MVTSDFINDAAKALGKDDESCFVIVVLPLEAPALVHAELRSRLQVPELRRICSEMCDNLEKELSE